MPPIRIYVYRIVPGKPRGEAPPPRRGRAASAGAAADGSDSNKHKKKSQRTRLLTFSRSFSSLWWGYFVRFSVAASAARRGDATTAHKLPPGDKLPGRR